MSTLKKHPKKNKQTAKDKVVGKSTETPKELSDVNKKHISEVLDSTKKIIDSIKEKLDQQEIEDMFSPVLENKIEVPVALVEESVDTIFNIESSNSDVPTIESTIEDSVTLTEDLLDTVLNIESSQVEIPTLETTIENTTALAEELLDAIESGENNQLEMNMDFNTEQTETVYETNMVYPQNMFDFLKENFEKTQQFTIINTKEIVGFHNENINRALNINRQLVESLNSQIESLLNLQNERSN